MRLKDLKQHYRNSYEFERATGLSHVNWSNWAKRGYIPIISQMRIEKITRGVFKADMDHTQEGGK